ncbi:hypothetical protein SISSUDRAFT_1058254 [Sistotremastrum suecicum HHB10207 ss-3]|uniref:Poly A polymerase C-terminal region-like protein n=1 Tax=Sistotremastrum suecicum HHB10207 ss-3 TaxID=1314776 RepID=A0A166HJK7_9AGAM|nr:hypothetical protein SISSUDRAFT_1058254 [Sistotremastrum suecicum HHB10207 ss-3]
MGQYMSLRDAYVVHKPSYPSTLDISLTEEEAKLFELLDNFTKQLLNDSNQNVECRVAGGWVRDKLLGQDSDDIDIALSSMMGLPFAEKFVEYVKSEKIDAGQPHAIKQNPDQSKHLEPARVKVLGYELDFVNLRHEEYAVDSRIPVQVKFGTPVQDATRRDLTFNALFYNIHKGDVEDHTGHGLDDLVAGIVRTPLPPKETFLDDPLRILRCMRFASRFGFEIDDSIIKAARDPVIQKALLQKVTRDRIGEELNKMLKGPDPMRAILLLETFHLFSPVFEPPTPYPFPSPKTYRSAVSAALILYSILYPPRSSQVPRVDPAMTLPIKSDKSTQARFFLAAALTPWKDTTYQEKKHVRSGVELVIRQGLKLGTQNNYLDGIPPLFEAAKLLANPTLQRFQNPSPRVAIGRLVRDKIVHKEHGAYWTTSLLFSLVQEIFSTWDPLNDTVDIDKTTDLINTYNAFVAKVEEYGLVPDPAEKALLTGHEICETLAVTRPGPWTGEVLSRLADWRFENPDGTKEAARAWLKREHDVGRISAVDRKRA